MDIRVTTPPTAMSVTVDLFKLQKRITNNSENALIEQIIQSADMYFQNKTNTALMQQQIEYRSNYVLPIIEIPRPPLVSIQSLSYKIDGQSEVVVDLAETEQRMCGGLSTISIPGIDRAHDGYVQVQYTAGYTASEDVPADIKRAVLLLAGHWFTNREATTHDQRVLNIDRKIAFSFDEIARSHVVSNMVQLNTPNV